MEGEGARAVASGHSWRGPLVLAAGLVAILALTLVQVEVGGRLVVVPALAFPPLAASLATSWRWTAPIGAASVAAVSVLSDGVGSLTSTDALARIAGTALLAATAVLNAVVRQRRDQHIRAVTEVATIAQATIMQPLPARVGHLDLASRYVSATADALVGGDLYDVVDTPLGVRIIVGDVRGKGLSALRTAASTLSAFRQLAPHAEISITDLARHIDAEVSRALSDEDFVTVILCQLEPTGRLQVVNCGHHPPVCLAPTKPLRVLATEHVSPPLGLGVTPEAAEFLLGPGDRLLLYTDGLVEARDGEGQFLDLADACACLMEWDRSLDDSLDALLEDVRRHVGGVLTDDLCVVLASRRIAPTVQIADSVLTIGEQRRGVPHEHA